MRFNKDVLDFRDGEEADADHMDELYGDAPPQLPADQDFDGNNSLASYQRKKHNIVNVKTLVNPVPKPNESIGKSAFFTATPAIVHFGGLVVGKTSSQTISVVNTSPTAQRLYVYPPSDEAFKAEYLKSGSLAPGMEQKITIKFTPTEYKYYHDHLRVQTEGGLFILVPLHAYPVLNKLEFPRNINFGEAPLCEPQVRVLRLRASIPVDFTFELEVTRPHPYFTIEPTEGIIPANGVVEIKVKFLPVTLGSCMLSMKLHVGQHGWVPMDCDVSGMGVSGLLESRALKDAERRLKDYIVEAGMASNEKLGKKSSFKGDVTFNNTSNLALTRTEMLRTQAMEKLAGPRRAPASKFLAPSLPKSHKHDPTSVLLSKTFKSMDLNTAMDRVLEGTHLLGSKVASRDPHSLGIRAIDGIPKMEVPAVPAGPGAGNAFDAGAQWMSLEQSASNDKMRASGATMGRTQVAPTREDKTVEGLRVPPDLDFFPAVNFVLTQEAGKLKPKDLKVAIENSRREREARAEEQAKLREEGGAAGQLDLRGVLADERLNLAEGDPFKRQLRELAFLADVDDLDKQEAEKEFRVSEEYLGATPLSEEDVALVFKQRAQSNNHKKRTTWRLGQARQHTLLCPPTHTIYKAGAPAKIAQRAKEVLEPSFDTNKNDIWAKRMNSLRRFVSLVSKWLVRRRLDTRMARLTDTFSARGLSTREQVLEYIVQENIEAKQNGPQSSLGDTKKGNNSNNNDADSSGGMPPVNEYPSVAAMICDAPPQALTRRIDTESIVGGGRLEFKSNMVRRVLFPKYVSEEGASRAAMPANGTDVLPSFDDRTFYQLKVRPEFVSMGYGLMTAQVVPLSFPSGSAQESRAGAYIEAFSRPAVDDGLKYGEMKSLTGDSDLLTLPDAVKEAVAWADTEVEPDLDDLSLMADMPSFLCEAVEWKSGEIDAFHTPSPFLQVFKRHPRRCSMQQDWSLRPGGAVTEALAYESDPSMRTRWIKEGGFRSANEYLLAGQESRNQTVAPASGPTLRNYYLQDSDRHASGLHCFANDHRRSVDEEDMDVAPLQSVKAKEDHLTDSESDDEDAYVQEKPSLAKARGILWDKQEDGAAAAAPGTQDSVDATEAFGLEADDDVNTEMSGRLQVELLRDRKIIELESNLRKDRYARMDKLTQRLVSISKACTSLPLALSVQLPFHQYEQDLIDSGVLEGHPELAMPQKTFTERGLNDTAPGSPMNMSLMSPMKSPQKP
jgi:hypothetical protein